MDGTKQELEAIAKSLDLEIKFHHGKCKGGDVNGCMYFCQLNERWSAFQPLKDPALTLKIINDLRLSVKVKLLDTGVRYIVVTNRDNQHAKVPVYDRQVVLQTNIDYGKAFAKAVFDYAVNYAELVLKSKE